MDLSLDFSGKPILLDHGIMYSKCYREVSLVRFHSVVSNYILMNLGEHIKTQDGSQVPTVKPQVTIFFTILK